jgi:hypothetical protein
MSNDPLLIDLRDVYKVFIMIYRWTKSMSSTIILIGQYWGIGQRDCERE